MMYIRSVAYPCPEWAASLAQVGPALLRMMLGQIAPKRFDTIDPGGNKQWIPRNATKPRRRTNRSTS